MAVVSLFSAKKVLDHPGGCPSALSSPLPRQGGSVADTWLGQLAPGLAVETWSSTAAASPSLHSAPLRLKLLTHPRGANSQSRLSICGNSLLLRGLARPTPSRASHTSTAPDPALSVPVPDPTTLPTDRPPSQPAPRLIIRPKRNKSQPHPPSPPLAPLRLTVAAQRSPADRGLTTTSSVGTLSFSPRLPTGLAVS